MLRFLPAITWTLALYAGTTLTAGKALAPAIAHEATTEQVKLAWFWFDVHHVVLHAAAYGVLGGLLALTARANRTRRERISLLVAFLVIILIVGLGQEAIQTAIRWEVRLADSMGDLVSNFSGAALSLGLVLPRKWQ